MGKRSRARRGILDGTEGGKRARNGERGRENAQDGALDAIGGGERAWEGVRGYGRVQEVVADSGSAWKEE